MKLTIKQIKQLIKEEIAESNLMGGGAKILKGPNTRDEVKKELEGSYGEGNVRDGLGPYKEDITVFAKTEDRAEEIYDELQAEGYYISGINQNVNGEFYVTVYEKN